MAGTSSVFDVIVVGAGPGGSNAAAVALKAGLSVAQIDRYKFPRVKPCAGGMTIKACDALQFDLSQSVRYTSNSIEMNLWNSHVNCFSNRMPILKMVLRPEFDNELVAQNLKSKEFRFFDGERVTGIDHNGVFTVRTDKRVLTARQLVGADGAQSIVNRIFGISSPRSTAVAIETNIYKKFAAVTGDIAPCFDFGVIDRGYGWIFPKDDHWSVGIYTLAKGIKDLRSQLQAYIAAKGFTLDDDVKLTFEAHTIPVGGYRLNPPKVPVYLVGDAGGFADALTGEGIYHALESGRLAGETLVAVASGKVSHRSYYRRIWRTVLSDTFLTYYGAKKFYRHIEWSIRALENPLVWRAFVQGYSEGATFTKSILLSGYYFLKSISAAKLRSDRMETEVRPPPSA